MNLYVYDQNLQRVGIIEGYESLIWVNRYNDLGDCELYIGADKGVLSLLDEDYYLKRDDDDMICIIKRIELDTDNENGNHLIINGYDVKRFADQRLILGTHTINGNVETAVRYFIEQNMINASNPDRNFIKPDGLLLVKLGTPSDLPEVVNEQITNINLGEKIRDYCKTFGWGYKAVMDEGSIAFYVYKGTDRSQNVVFSDQFDNLSSSKFVSDSTDAGNVAVIAGDDEATTKDPSIYGSATSSDRYEIYVDANSVTRTMTYEELKDQYPLIEDGGQGYIGEDGDGYSYYMRTIDIQIVGSEHLAWLQDNYPDGTIVTVSGNQYYRLANVAIAGLKNSDPNDDSEVTLFDLVYLVLLMSQGAEAVAQHGNKITFEGSVISDITFTYKKDYFLGDIVRVKNEYGIEADARIIEITEVEDTNGYSIEPKFEYIY